jgi:hypothetical protein
MLIHVAQNGKKFQLDCQASTRYDSSFQSLLMPAY